MARKTTRAESELRDELANMADAADWTVTKEYRLTLADKREWGRVDLLLERDGRTVVVECKRGIHRLRELRQALEQVSGYGRWMHADETWLICDATGFASGFMLEGIYNVRLGTPRDFIAWTGMELDAPAPPEPEMMKVYIWTIAANGADSFAIRRLMDTLHEGLLFVEGAREWHLDYELPWAYERKLRRWGAVVTEIEVAQGSYDPNYRMWP